MDNIEKLGDKDLFALFVDKGKPEKLFREIMRRFKQKVYWQCRRLVILHDDADEVTQIVFIKLWKNAENFRFDSALSSFIYRIAFNESVSLLKQKQKFTSFDQMLDKDGHFAKSIEYGGEMNGNDIAAKLQLALLRLPEKQRIVFQYRYFDDLSYREISEITGTSEGALKASYHFAADKIKFFLEQV